MEDPVERQRLFRICKTIDFKSQSRYGGWKVIDLDGVKELAAYHPEMLIMKVLGGLMHLLQDLQNVLQGNIRNLVYALNGIKEQKSTSLITNKIYEHGGNFKWHEKVAQLIEEEYDCIRTIRTSKGIGRRIWCGRAPMAVAAAPAAGGGAAAEADEEKPSL